MRELEDLRRREAGGGELAVGRGDAMCGPRRRIVARQRADVAQLSTGRLLHAVELDVVAGDAVVGVTPAVPLMGVAVLDRDATSPLQVLQRRDDLRRVKQQQL